jgi:hypothetical protein
MKEALQWLLQNAWVGWVLGAAIGLALGIPLTVFDKIRRATGADDSTIREQLKEQQQIRLLCGDARALAYIAIQRHLSDAVFRRRLQAQPCHAVLWPYFSAEFRGRLLQDPMAEDGPATLANVCLEEIERLERGLANTALHSGTISENMDGEGHWIFR